MSGEKRAIFREKALERLSSPEQLDQLMHLVGPRDWLPLAALGSLVSAGVVWSFLGQIPVTVTGQGVLIYPRQVVPLQSPLSGSIEQLYVEEGDRIQAGERIARLDQAELRQELQLEQERLAELQDQDQLLTSLQQQRQTLELQEIQAQRQTLQRNIQEIEFLLPQLQSTDREVLAQQQISLEQQLRDAQELEPKLKQRLDSRQDLFDQGALSTDALLQAEQEYRSGLATITDLEARLKELEAQRVQNQRTYVDNLNQLGDLSNQLQALDTRQTSLTQQDLESDLNRENQILDASRRIEQLQVQLQTQTEIRSEHGGQILDLAVVPGQVVNAGAPLGSLEIEDDSRQLLSVTYFEVADGKQIGPETVLQITPSTVQREDYGGILAQIQSISPLPPTQESALALLGSADLTQGLLGQTPKIEVRAQLSPDPSTVSGYQWSSSQGPALTLTPGTTTSVRATVDRRAPISFLLPLLRRTSGLY